MAEPNGDTGRESLVREYSRLAGEYDTRWSFYIDATTRATLDRMPAHPAGRLLDVGCGTGALLQTLGHTHPELDLVGVDPVPEMLAVARRRAPSATAFSRAWAEALPFADDTFDLVVSCNMFHYIRQPAAALREMSRVLRPGGALLITDWCDDYLACRVCDWWLRRFSPAHVKVYRERECLRMLREGGFPNARIERYKINWLWGMMTANATKPSA